MDKYRLKLIFTQPLLGTVPKDPEVYKTYIASKFEASNDELETLEEAEEKGWTGFHWQDGIPILYDYQIKGFFKSACGALLSDPQSFSSNLRAYKKKIDMLVFPTPRHIPIVVNGDMSVLERPLRAQTPRGERVTLVRSDAIPIGSSIEFEVVVLGAVTEELLVEWLEYGKWYGLGQWRNASYGRFEYEMTAIR